MLRVSLAYLDHSRKHQAITYALEAVIEEALLEDFSSQGSAVVDHWQHLDPTAPETFDKLDSRGAIFCSWTKTRRKRHFVNLLTSFSPMYESIYEVRVRNGESDLLAPDELNRWTNAEWPNPRC